MKLQLFRRDYTENPSVKNCHSYGDALDQITQELNESNVKYQIIDIHETRLERKGDEYGKPLYLPYANGEVTVLVEIFD